MKKMKRLVATFLAGMMMLAMLTACGGGTTTSQKVDFADETISQILEDNGLTKPDGDFDIKVREISEKYASEITDENYGTIVQEWYKTCVETLDVQSPMEYASSRFMRMSKESITATIQDYLPQIINKYYDDVTQHVCSVQLVQVSSSTQNFHVLFVLMY